MSRLEPPQEYNPIIDGEQGLNHLRQAVDKIFEEVELDIYRPTDELPSTARTPLTHEGEPVDEAKRQRIIEAEQEVADSYEIETMPKPEPSSFDQLHLG